MEKSFQLNDEEVRKLVEVFADPDEQPKASREREELLRKLVPLIPSEYREAFLTITKPKGAAADLAAERECSRERIRQFREEVMERMQLCLKAPWLAEFRHNVLQGMKTELPDITYISWSEIQAGRKLDQSQKERIIALRQEGKAAGTIAELIEAHRGAVNFVLKQIGENPYHERDILHTEFIQAHATSQGRTSEAAKILKRSAESIRKKWKDAGLDTSKKIISDKTFIEAHKKYGGNAKATSQEIGCDLGVVYKRWKKLKLPTDKQLLRARFQSRKKK